MFVRSMSRTRSLCLLGSGLIAGFAGVAVAQDGEKKAPKESVEEVVVTGSRIARDSLEGLGPITVLTSEDIASSGVNSVDELLRELPSVGFGGISQNANNGGGGLRFVDLRSLGSTRVLVLLNGRRLVTNGTGAGEAVDINNVPTALVERVDVLRDGVSTIYGADALAGVINFVLKDDYEGFQAELIGGIAQQGDAEESGINLLWGKNWARSNLTLSGTVYNREEVDQVDRDWARNPISAVTRDPNEPTGLRVVPGSTFVEEGRVGGRIFRPGMDANGNPTSFKTFDNRTESYDFGQAQYLVPAIQRFVFNGSYRFELTDSIELFAEGEWAQRYSETKLAPVPAGAISSRANLAGVTFPIYADSSRNNPFLPQDFVDTVLAGRDQANITFQRRYSEAGARLSTPDSLTQRFVGGFRGELDGWLGPLNWEVFGNYGRNQTEEHAAHTLNVSNILASLQPEVCARTPGCVVGNFFGKNALLETPGAIDFIRFTARDRLGFHMKEVGANIGGDVYALPAGPVKAVIGGEYRKEDGFVDPDFFSTTGDSSTNGLDPTRGEFSVRQYFFESTVPILNGVPFAEELSLEISGRFADYTSFGSKYLSRYGFSWAPTAELRLRGVYATAFRQPGISDLFGGGADAFPALRDPCNGFGDPALLSDPVIVANCAAQLPDSGRFNADNPFLAQNAGTGQQIRTNVGGNPDLQEEVAKTSSYGFVWRPGFLPDAAIGADYYHVEIDDPIVNPSSQDKLTECLESVGLSSSDCQDITRLADGGVGLIEVPTTNLGKVETQGIDFDISYALDLPWVGPVDLGFLGNYVLDYIETDNNGSEKFNGRLGIPNFKGRITSRIQPTDNLSLNLTSRYIGRADIQDRREQNLPFSSVPSVWYVDTSARYSLNENYTFSFGVRNLGDKRPPFVVNGTNAAGGTYDFLGRYYFARITATF